MAFGHTVFDNGVFQMYRNHRVDEKLVYYQKASQILQFDPSWGVIDVWSDDRCYSPATDQYVRPLSTNMGKSIGFSTANEPNKGL